MKPVVPTSKIDVLQVTYKQPNGREIMAHLGIKLVSEMIKDEPTVFFDRLKDDSYYTLLLIDTDLLVNEPKSVQIYGRVYWLLYNVSSKGKHDIKAPYLAPKAIELFENHRYMFLMYKQDSVIDNILPKNALDNADISKRNLIHLNNFESMYNLEMVAANFIYYKSSNKIFDHYNKLYDREENDKPNGIFFQKKGSSEHRNIISSNKTATTESKRRRRFTALNQTLKNSKFNCFKK